MRDTMNNVKKFIPAALLLAASAALCAVLILTGAPKSSRLRGVEMSEKERAGANWAIGSLPVRHFRYEVTSDIKSVRVYSELWENGVVSDSVELYQKDLTEPKNELYAAPSITSDSTGKWDRLFFMLSDDNASAAGYSLSIPDGACGAVVSSIESESCGIIAGQPVTLMCVGFQMPEDAGIASVSGSRLISDPAAAAKYKCAMTVSCVFSDKSAEDTAAENEPVYEIQLLEKGVPVGGELLLSESSESAARDMIMHAFSRSMTVPGRSIASIDSCIRIRESFLSGESSEYYAYFDGERVLFQFGADGFCVVSSQDEYNALLNIL